MVSKKLYGILAVVIFAVVFIWKNDSGVSQDENIGAGHASVSGAKEEDGPAGTPEEAARPVPAETAVIGEKMIAGGMPVLSHNLKKLAEEAARHVKELDMEIQGGETGKNIIGHYNKGLVLGGDGKYKEAAAEMRNALAMSEDKAFKKYLRNTDEALRREQSSIREKARAKKREFEKSEKAAGR